MPGRVELQLLTNCKTAHIVVLWISRRYLWKELDNTTTRTWQTRLLTTQSQELDRHDSWQHNHKNLTDTTLDYTITRTWQTRTWQELDRQNYLAQFFSSRLLMYYVVCWLANTCFWYCSLLFPYLPLPHTYFRCVLASHYVPVVFSVFCLAYSSHFSPISLIS